MSRDHAAAMVYAKMRIAKLKWILFLDRRGSTGGPVLFLYAEAMVQSKQVSNGSRKSSDKNLARPGDS